MDNPLMLAVIALGGLLSVGLLAYGIISARGSTSVVQERLGRYAETGIQATVAETPTAKPRQSPLGERLNEALRNLSFFSKVQDNLNAADIKLNVGEFFAFALIVCIAGILLGVIITVFPDCSGSSIGFLPCLVTRNYTDALVLAVIGRSEERRVGKECRL